MGSRRLSPPYCGLTMKGSADAVEMPGLRKPESPVKEFDKAELKERLTPTQYLVTQEHQTEKQFSNKYYKHREKGVYTCVVCSIQHFSSASKYDSGSGWPSFFDIIDNKKIRLRKDASGVGGNLLRIRTEVSCAECGAHLGHVFEDGPKPTGLRYCVNSAQPQRLRVLQQWRRGPSSRTRRPWEGAGGWTGSARDRQSPTRRPASTSVNPTLSRDIGEYVQR